MSLYACLLCANISNSSKVSGAVVVAVVVVAVVIVVVLVGITVSAGGWSNPKAAS